MPFHRMRRVPRVKAIHRSSKSLRIGPSVRRKSTLRMRSKPPRLMPETTDVEFLHTNG
jgi:hypothetical protein